jgi:hypothetical protein
MQNARRCFMCHTEIGRKKGNETVEHIPMRSLFDGYTTAHKANRITVPCCTSCNNATSLIDEEFRNFIASISDDPILLPMADKAIRSVLDYRKMFDMIYTDPETGVTGLLTRPKVVVEYQKKVFKGLFYHQYKAPLPEKYEIKVDIDRERNKFKSIPFINYYNKNFLYKHSGSPDVFKFILQPFRAGLKQTVKQDLVLAPSDNHFVSIQIFNNCFQSVVYAHIPKGTESF